MVLDHVSQRSGLVVVPAAVADTQALGDRDLDMVYVAPVPDRFEDAVGEAKDEDVLNCFFAKVVVDSVDGILRARLAADTAFLYEAQQIWELQGNVVVNFYDALGATTSTITSDEGTYNLRTTDMEARGNVVGTTPDGRRLTTTIMRYESVSDELVGPEFFRFRSADEDMQGSSFRADPDFTRVRVTQARGTPGITEPRR